MSTLGVRTEALLLTIECAIQFAQAKREYDEGRGPLALVQQQHDRLRAAVTGVVQAWQPGVDRDVNGVLIDGES